MILTQATTLGPVPESDLAAIANRVSPIGTVRNPARIHFDITQVSSGIGNVSATAYTVPVNRIAVGLQLNIGARLSDAAINNLDMTINRSDAGGPFNSTIRRLLFSSAAVNSMSFDVLVPIPYLIADDAIQYSVIVSGGANWDFYVSLSGIECDPPV